MLELSLSPAASCGSPGARGCPPGTGYHVLPVAQGIGGRCGRGPLLWGREGRGVWVPVSSGGCSSAPPQGSPAMPPLLASEKGPGRARRDQVPTPGRQQRQQSWGELGGDSSDGHPRVRGWGRLGALRDTGRCRDTGRRSDTARGGSSPPPGGAPPPGRSCRCRIFSLSGALGLGGRGDQIRAAAPGGPARGEAAPGGPGPGGAPRHAPRPHPRPGVGPRAAPMSRPPGALCPAPVLRVGPRSAPLSPRGTLPCAHVTQRDPRIAPKPRCGPRALPTLPRGTHENTASPRTHAPHPRPRAPEPAGGTRHRRAPALCFGPGPPGGSDPVPGGHRAAPVHR